MSKLLTSIVIVLGFLAILVSSGVVLPPPCTSGGGSALGTVVQVQAVGGADVSGVQPYNLTTLQVYNVTFTFVVATSAVGQDFNITIFYGGGLQLQLATLPIGTLTATELTSALVASLGLSLPCLAAVVDAILNGILTLQALCTHIGQTFCDELLSALPQVSVSLEFTLPALFANTVATIQGLIAGGGSVTNCMQGLTNITPAL